MSSLRLNPFIINELCDVVVRSHDEATVVKYVLSSKEAFVSFIYFVRDHITARFDKYNLDFYADNVKLETSLLFLVPKMINKFVMMRAGRGELDFCDDFTDTSCSPLKILNKNKVIDTIDISFDFYYESKFLAALLCRWQGVKNLTCRTRVLLDTAHGNKENLKRLIVLNLCDYYDTCVPFLTILPLLTSLQALKMKISGVSGNVFDIVYDHDVALTALSLRLKVYENSLDYFHSMFAFSKQFPKLALVEVEISNMNLQSMDNLISNIDEFQLKFEKSELKAYFQFHLNEDYIADFGDEEINNSENHEANSVILPPDVVAYESKVNELLAKGFKLHSHNVYRRRIQHTNSVFTHHVCFHNLSEFRY